MILAFVSVFAYKRIQTGHGFVYSIEFTGGTQGVFKFDIPVRSSQIIDILEKHGWSGIITREFGPHEILVRIKETANDVVGLGERMRTVLEEELKTSVKLLQIDSIGQGIGQALSWNSLKAIIIGLALMLVYLAWRFWSFSYGMGAVVALFHDAIAILLFFLLFDKEISVNVIAAILAILGYSVNDTIVIFAQIRQNIKTIKNMSLHQIANLSLNQTLRRTILTSFATLLVVIALIVFGGETLRDLSLALLIGIIFGTYSSIYIASPVMLALHKAD